MNPEVQDVRATEIARSALDQLLEDSKLYKNTTDYKNLLDFIVRLRNFAPFNAMLLQIQKPGLSYAASALDWNERFNRTVKEGARPLLILWPFGPVAFVYDVMDTEGAELPSDVKGFVAVGSIDALTIMSYAPVLIRKRIDLRLFDAGDFKAGSIEKTFRNPDQPPAYKIYVNQNHSPNVQFATIAHELGHLFLGHLGSDITFKVHDRQVIPLNQREIEAESVAYLVCARNGVASKSEIYLADLVEKKTSVDSVDLYQITRAAGQVEALLGLTTHLLHSQHNPAQDQLNLFPADGKN